MLFRRGEKRAKPQFINHPIYSYPEEPFEGNLYELTYFPPIPLDKFTEKGITGPCKALYTTAASVIKNLAYQLYNVPAVRRYYGAEFVHGVAAEYDPTQDCLVFTNLDDTPETLELLRELTRALSIILKECLDRYDLYLHYQGESLRFITGDQKRRLKHIQQQDRIVW